MPDSHSISVERRVRPLRIGFAVDLNNARQVKRAIEVASAQWGGLHCPLLPKLATRPRWWRPSIGPGPSGKEIEAQFRELFEPDYVVDLQSRKRSTYREIGPRELITDDRWSRITAGLPTEAIFRDLWERRDRFLERSGAEAVVPKAEPRDLNLFVAAVFGSFARDDALSGNESSYRQLFNAKDKVITPESLLDGYGLTGIDLFYGPLQVAAQGFQYHGGVHLARVVLFLLDAERPGDVVEFWNFRALGKPVIPLPTQWQEKLISQLISRLNGSPLMRGEEIDLRSAQRVSEEIVKATQEELGAGGLKVVRTSWLPWTTRPDPKERLEVVADEDRVSVGLRDGTARVGLPAPSAANYYPGGSSRWMSVLRPASWSLEGAGLSALIPPGLDDVGTLVQSHSHLDVRASREGIVVPSGGVQDEFDWRPPTGTEVIQAVFKSVGIDAEPSRPGRVASELIRRVGGLLGVGLVQYEPLIRLLDSAARVDVAIEDEESEGRQRPRADHIKRNTLYQTLARIHGGDGDRERKHLRSLVNRGVLSSGPRLQCPHCTHTNWVSVDGLSEEVTCRACLRAFPFPHADPPLENEWAYRPVGAFSFPGFASGSYSVGFALRFLARDSFEPTAWSTNLDLGDGLEVDFVLLRESRERIVPIDDPPVLLLGEAKTYGKFEKKDFARMIRLRSLFPEAILVFATLRKSLTQEEKRAMKKLAQPAVSRAKAVPYSTGVMLLTGHELFSRKGPPHCWAEVGGRIAEIASKNEVIANDPRVHQIADLTLQIHLGLKPHHQWASRTYKRLAREKKKRRVRTTTRRRKSGR